MLDPLYIDPLYIYSTEKVHLNRITDKSNLVLVPWEDFSLGKQKSL